jgi:hypothetical protein
MVATKARPRKARRAMTGRKERGPCPAAATGADLTFYVGRLNLHHRRVALGVPLCMRTFRVVEVEPLATSFGEDLYRRIFADAAEATD